jgi:hypothetical protein
MFMTARAHHPSITVSKSHKSDRSFGCGLNLKARICSCSGTRSCLSRSDLGMVSMTQHLKPTPTSAVGLQVVMASRSVSLAFTGFDVIDLTVAPRCGATRTDAVVFGSAFC